MARRSRHAERTTFLLGLIAAVAIGGVVSAHRGDEYLQIARLSLEPARVGLELDLTPGIAVADAIIADIDLDQDGSLSPVEQQVYTSKVLSAAGIDVDGHSLDLRPTAASFPDADSMRRGEGTIRLQSTADLPSKSVGVHQLFFRNANRPDVSVYLANATVPESDQVAVLAQRRDPDQRELNIEYVLRPSAARVAIAWLLVGISGAVVGAKLLALTARTR